MAKSLQRHPSIPNDKNQIGCISGLIRIFDFSRSHFNQKRLLDRRFGSKHSVGAGQSQTKTDPLPNSDEHSHSGDDNEENKMVITVADKPPSVKRLMEEDMHAEEDLKKHDNNVDVETGFPNLESGGSIKGKKMKMKVKKVKKKKKKKKISNGHISDIDVAGKVALETSYQQNLEQEFADYASINSIMDELCSQIQNNNLSSTESKLKFSVSHEAIKVFLETKFINGKHNAVDERSPHSKEFLDALQTLNSNRELLLKLLQDPNPVLWKYFQSILDFRVEKNEKSMTIEGPTTSRKEPSSSKQSKDLSSHKHHNVFGWMKFRGGKPSMNDGDSNRIVILKPGPEGLQNPKTETDCPPSPESSYIEENNGMIEQADSQFSLAKMSRKFKKAMGRDLHGVSVGNSSSRFLSDSDKKIGGEIHSPNRDHFFNERIPRSSFGTKKGEKSRNSKELPELITSGYPKRRVSSVHVEAMNHLSETLSQSDENEGFSSRRDPESLRRILSLPEYNSSPVSSPRRNWEPSPVSPHTRLSASNRHQMVNDNVWKFKLKKNSCVSSTEQNLATDLSIHGGNADEAQSSHPNVSDEAIHDSDAEVTLCSITDEVNSREARNSLFQKESNVLDVPSEPIGTCLNRNEQNGDLTEACDGGISECLKLHSTEEKQSSSPPFSSPSRSSIDKKEEHLEISIDREERPSPVSVLDPLFAEDELCSRSTVGDAAELSIQPHQINFEEPGFTTEDCGTWAKTCIGDKEMVFEFIKAVLQASRASWDEFFTTSLPSDKPLDASLLQEVELFPNELCHDTQLLLDCMNEVLVEVFEHYFGCSPWVSFVKPSIRPIPNSVSVVVDEVWEGVSWLLLPLRSASTLEQIVGKDLGKSGTWMDLRTDVETIGIGMGDAIVKELIDETVGSCLYGRR